MEYNNQLHSNNGWIQFDDVTARYPLRIDLILKKISFEILPGQRVAVVGRTGSGKSSLVMSLFRMLETVDGTVYIDGWDVSKLPLGTHRSRLNIIPQVSNTRGCVSHLKNVAFDRKLLYLVERYALIWILWANTVTPTFGNVSIMPK